MKELKTLIELELYKFAEDGHSCPVCNLHNGGHELNYCSCEGVEIKELRQEVEKWIEELEKQSKKIIKEKEKVNVDTADYLIQWIKHFFNLKDGKTNKMSSL